MKTKTGTIEEPEQSFIAIEPVLSPEQVDKSIENNSEEIIHITNELNNNEPEFIDGELGTPTPNPNFKYQFKTNSIFLVNVVFLF